MLKKLIIAGIAIAIFVVVINVPYSYEEYGEDGDLIVRNATGWDREIFSDYKTFELKDNHGTPLFVIPYKLDVDIENAEFKNDGHSPTLIYLTFDKPTNQKTMEIMLRKTLEPESSDLILQSFLHDEMTTIGRGVAVPTEFHFPFFKIKYYDTHYLVTLYNDKERNLEYASLVVLPTGKLFSFNSELGWVSYWKSFSHVDFDYFPLLSHQQEYGVSEDNLQCPKDFELVLNSDIPKCIKSESIMKLIENKLKN